MLIEKWKIIAIAIFSFAVVNVFFFGLKSDEFLMLHDELIALNYNDAIKGLYVRAFHDLNVDNITILTVTVMDRLYYYFGYRIGLDLQFLQRLFYFIKLFILLTVPYIGFRKFSEKIKGENGSNIPDYTIWLITFLYAFNTFTTIYWHGHAFQLSLLLCYSFAPLALYYFDKIIHDPVPKFRIFLMEALIFLVMSSSLYLFAVFVFIAITYYAGNLLTNHGVLKSSLLNLFKLLFICMPLYAIFLPTVLGVILGGGTVNAIGGETYSNLRGGLLYPLFLWFSWGIYNDWFPKNIFTFNQYFHSIIYLSSTLAIYIIIFWSISKRIISNYIIYFLLILVVALIFVKGAQPPFQEIYIQLMQRFPPFRVFRSPDNKFGFGIMLSLSFLLLIASTNIKKRVFTATLLFIVLVQGYLILSGIAIKGQNTETSSDRVIHIPGDYQELADYVNTEGNTTGYILPIPPTSFGHFILSPTEKHLGQDLISKLVENPFLTPDEYSSMSLITYKKLTEVLDNNLGGISEFPIEYFLYRRDLEFLTSKTDLDFSNNSKLVKVFSNDTFDLYQNSNSADIIEAENVEAVSFETISPVEYKVSITGINEESILILNTNYNSNWKIYALESGKVGNNSKFTFYPNRSASKIETNNNRYKGYANSWNLNKNKLIEGKTSEAYTPGANNTLNGNFVIYYQPQSDFYIYVLITVIFALVYATFIVIKHDN